MYFCARLNLAAREGATVRRWVRFAGLKSWVFACAAAVMLMAVSGAHARQPVRKPLAKAQPAKSSAKAMASKAVKGRRGAVAVRGKKSSKSRAVARRPVVPAAPSVGQLAGLHAGDDPLDLKSAVALVIDQETTGTPQQERRRGATHCLAHQIDDRARHCRRTPVTGRAGQR